MTKSTSAPAIDCNGSWQKVSTQEIATPYCEVNYLRQIARTHGVRIANHEIRQRPNKKGEVCRFMEDDICVSDICSNYLNDDSRY